MGGTRRRAEATALTVLALLDSPACCCAFMYQPAVGQIWDPSVLHWNDSFYAISMYSPKGDKQYPSGFLSSSADGTHWEDVGPIAESHANCSWWKGFTLQRPDATFVLAHGVYDTHGADNTTHDGNDALRILTSTDLQDWTEVATSKPDAQWYKPTRWDHMYMKQVNGSFIGFPVSEPVNATKYATTWPGVQRSPDGVVWTAEAPLDVRWGDIAPQSIEEGGIERLMLPDDTYRYFLIGGQGGGGGCYQMWAFVSDSDNLMGPYSPTQERFRMSGGLGGWGTCYSFWASAVGTYAGSYYSRIRNKNSDFRGSSSVIKTVSIRETFKHPAVFVQIQPFLELKEPNISLESPNLLESASLNFVYILTGLGTSKEPLISQYITPKGGSAGRYDVWMLPMRSPVTAQLADGTPFLRMGYWSGNDALLGASLNPQPPSTATVKCTSGSYHAAWIADLDAVSHSRGAYLLANLTASGEGAVGFTIESPGSTESMAIVLTVSNDSNATNATMLRVAGGKSTVIDTAGSFPCGGNTRNTTCGVASVTGVAPRGVVHAVRLFVRRGMFELYVNELLVTSHVYNYTANATGRVGLACSGASTQADLTDVRVGRLTFLDAN